MADSGNPEWREWLSGLGCPPAGATVPDSAECAIGYWGLAMSYVHPLLHDVPPEAELLVGLELLEDKKQEYDLVIVGRGGRSGASSTRR